MLKFAETIEKTAVDKRQCPGRKDTTELVKAVASEGEKTKGELCNSVKRVKAETHEHRVWKPVYFDE